MNSVNVPIKYPYRAERWTGRWKVTGLWLLTVALDSLAPTVCTLEFREEALAEAQTGTEWGAEVEVCLVGGTGIDEARLLVEVSLVLPGLDVEGLFFVLLRMRGNTKESVKIMWVEQNIMKEHKVINKTMRKLYKVKLRLKPKTRDNRSYKWLMCKE